MSGLATAFSGSLKEPLDPKILKQTVATVLREICGFIDQSFKEDEAYRAHLPQLSPIWNQAEILEAAEPNAQSKAMQVMAGHVYKFMMALPVESDPLHFVDKLTAELIALHASIGPRSPVVDEMIRSYQRYEPVSASTPEEAAEHTQRAYALLKTLANGLMIIPSSAVDVSLVVHDHPLEHVAMADRCVTHARDQIVARIDALATGSADAIVVSQLGNSQTAEMSRSI